MILRKLKSIVFTETHFVLKLKMFFFIIVHLKIRYNQTIDKGRKFSLPHNFLEFQKKLITQREINWYFFPILQFEDWDEGGRNFDALSVMSS